MRDPHDNRTADYIEDAEQGRPLNVDQALTDQALEAGGLKPVKAWVRTKQASNAMRTKRYKERQAAEGVRQINVQAPQEAHEALKALAARTKAGEPLESVLADLAGSRVMAPEPLSPALAAVERTLEAGGLRARLIRLLSGAPT
jgi:hypothetical protein